ncbi:ARF GTPase-activating protein GIT2-like isoform X2 [Macrobrachium nipponense]|uniref:ARF GTPase-activating protein GIT2-like isoform X2 n=1 Tax=Macrobrachium nipponense TaxID=159736 RepID=UPI0030C7C69B
MSRVGGGARTKPRTSQDVCADCGAPDAGWASINRGILICDECCSVHRSLGRHISQIKSLKKGTWNPIQLSMVHTLSSSGANHIWEHTLLDPSVARTGRRKPQPKDPVHPTKADFIRAKHQMLSFVYRPQREDSNGSDVDLSRQLHSSVRTANLETSLRLLSQGADPNFYHKEKGCYPLHVAARAGQSSQAELLIVYGADPGALDAKNNTPAHYASESNHSCLAEHLLESQYELTDRLAFYLCGRKPDHTMGQHWIIPEMANSLDMSDLAKEARSKLQNLSNNLFEELACDVYDEVDRRETDSTWLSLQNQSALVSDRCTVPFLPVNPEYSSTRNQGRQKLARFNAREFATLIIDVLSDAKRRQTGISSPTGTPKEKDFGDVTLTMPNSPKIPPVKAPHSSTSTPANSSPVNSNDIHHLRHTQISITSSISSSTDPMVTTTQTPPLSLINNNANNNNKGELTDDGEPLYDSVASEDDYTYVEMHKKLEQQKAILAEQTRQNQLHESFFDQDSPQMEAEISLETYLQMKEKLESSEAKIQELQCNNAEMRHKLNELSSTVKSLQQENINLRSMYNSGSSGLGPPTHSTPPPPLLSSTMSQSLYNGDVDPQVNMRTTCTSRVPSQRPFSMFEARQGPPNAPGQSHHMDQARTSSYQMATVRMSGEYDNTQMRSPSLEPTETTPLNPHQSLPSQEEVVRKTEVITKRIQELLISAQEGRQDSFVPCAEQIHSAVLDMDAIFPKDRCSSGVQGGLRQLVSSATRLQNECRGHLTAQPNTLDPKFVTQQVIQCAYDIAKAAKLLVTHFQ